MWGCVGGVNASLLSTFHFPCFTPSVKSFTCNPFSSMFNLSIYSCNIFQRLMCFHYFSLLPPAPTNSPTAGPTDSPTLHFCDSGEHQCDVANGVCVEHPSGWFDVYECECNEGYGNRPPYHFCKTLWLHIAKFLLITSAFTIYPHPSSHPLPSFLFHRGRRKCLTGCAFPYTNHECETEGTRRTQLLPFSLLSLRWSFLPLV